MRRTPACRLAIARRRPDAKLTISTPKVRVAHLTFAGSRARQSARPDLAVDLLGRVPFSGHPCAFGFARRRPRRRRCGRRQGQRCRRHGGDRLGGHERGGSRWHRCAHEQRAQDRRRWPSASDLSRQHMLTLSEDARVVIDRYVYDPGQGMGDVLLTTTQGAFRFATNGSCVETDKDGDNVFTAFDNHNHYLKDGTGKYQGITGKIPHTVTTLHDAVDGHAASIINHKTTWEVK